MNFDSISTVSDLITQNEEKTPLETALEALTECDYAESKKVATWLISNMVDFHKEMTLKALKGETENNPIAWCADTTTLEIALSLLNDVE